MTAPNAYLDNMFLFSGNVDRFDLKTQFHSFWPAAEVGHVELVLDHIIADDFDGVLHRNCVPRLCNMLLSNTREVYSKQ